jgi:CDP-diglyceride synthetase
MVGSRCASKSKAGGAAQASIWTTRRFTNFPANSIRSNFLEGTGRALGCSRFGKICMHLWSMLQALALLALANGAPVIAKRTLRGWFTWPLDTNIEFVDGRPLFGRSKTWRGIVAAVLITAGCASVIGVDAGIGATVAHTAMAGDLLSSFIKRRLGRPPSSRALGLDQVPESVFPLRVCRQALSLTPLDVAVAGSVFFVGELGLSRLLYKIHARDEPY